jgi:hypothetical protein
LALLAGLADRPAQGGPSKRYVGQPVAAPEPIDPVTDETLHGLGRSLADRYLTVPATPAPPPAAAPVAAPTETTPAEQAAHYTGVIVLSLLAASLMVLGLLGLRRYRRRVLANSLTRYAITYRQADLKRN